MSENANRIQCEKTIYRKFHETIENTYFLNRDFFVFEVKK